MFKKIDHWGRNNPVSVFNRLGTNCLSFFLVYYTIFASCTLYIVCCVRVHAFRTNCPGDSMWYSLNITKQLIIAAKARTSVERTPLLNNKEFSTYWHKLVQVTLMPITRLRHTPLFEISDIDYYSLFIISVIITWLCNAPFSQHSRKDTLSAIICITGWKRWNFSFAPDFTLRHIDLQEEAHIEQCKHYIMTLRKQCKHSMLVANLKLKRGFKAIRSQCFYDYMITGCSDGSTEWENCMVYRMRQDACLSSEGSYFSVVFHRLLASRPIRLYCVWPLIGYDQAFVCNLFVF